MIALMIGIAGLGAALNVGAAILLMTVNIAHEMFLSLILKRCQADNFKLALKICGALPPRVVLCSATRAALEAGLSSESRDPLQLTVKIKQAFSQEFDLRMRPVRLTRWLSTPGILLVLLGIGNPLVYGLPLPEYGYAIGAVGVIAFIMRWRTAARLAGSSALFEQSAPELAQALANRS